MADTHPEPTGDPTAAATDAPSAPTRAPDASRSASMRAPDASGNGDADAGDASSPVEPPAASTATAPVIPERKTRTKEHREAAKGTKPGSPGDFEGKALVFLQSYIEEFIGLDRSPAGKGARFKKFWRKVNMGLWEILSLDEGREILELAPNTAERAIRRRMEDKLRSWYNWRLRTSDDIAANPWTAWLRKIKFTPTEPRKPVAWQYYHTTHGDAVTEAYERRGGSDPKDRLRLRNAIAREQFFALPASEQEELEKQAVANYEKEMEDWRALGTDLGEVSADQHMQARAHLSQIVMPLLKGIAHFTGMRCMTLLAGEPPNETTDDYTCLAIHVGESVDAEPLTFGTFDPVAFEKNVVGHFLEFVQSTSEQTRLSAAQRVATVANPLPIRVQIADPYEAERQDNAKQAAAEENSKRKDQKKNKDKKKKKKRTLANGEEVEGLAEPATSSPEPPSSPGEAPSSATQQVAEPAGDGPVRRQAGKGKSTSKPKPRPKKSIVSLTENAGDALRAKVALLSEGERVAEIVRLNALSVEALAMEGEQARIEALGGDAMTQDEFVQQAPESPRGNTDASSAFSSSPSLPSLSLFHPSSPFSFESDLHTIPPLPLNPDDPLSWSPVRQPHGSTSFSVSNSHAFPTSRTPPPDESPAQQLSQQDLQDDRASEESSDREATPDTYVPDTLQDAPAWVVLQYNKFLEEDVPDEIKEDWSGLLDDWVALERAMGFSAPHTGFSTTGRPEALGLWVKQGRGKRIQIKNPRAFCGAWYRWWKGINPTWRREAGDVLAIGGDGDWSTMFLPGPNGFLNVLGSLLGVRDVEKNDEKWMCAVRDVRWTVGQVLAAKRAEPHTTAAAESRTPKRARRKGPSAGPRASKRPRHEGPSA